MGFFKKLGREIKRGASSVGGVYEDIYTGNFAAGGWGLYARDPQGAREKLGIDEEPLAPEPYTSGSPYARGAEGGWDENGYPIGPMPRGEHSLDWQYEANRKTEERRNMLWGDAQRSMDQGMDLFQSYRPGGSAALASGQFQSKANLSAMQAQSQESPDLLMGWRDRKQQEAEQDRNQAERMNRTLGLIQTGVGLAASVATGGASLGLAANGLNTLANADPGGGYDANAVVGQGSRPIGSNLAGGGWQAGPGVANGPAPSGGPGLVGGPNAVQTQGSYGGGGGAGVGAPAGAGGGGVGGAGTAQSRVQGPGGGGMGGGGAGAGGVGAPGTAGAGVDTPGGTITGYDPQATPGAMQRASSGLAGDAPMMTFTQEEAAGAAMASTPGAGAIVYPDWADDVYRMEGVGWWAKASRERLIRAYQGTGRSR